MHRSQRTGLLTWLTMRESTSRPEWMTAPSTLETSGTRASWVETARASRPISATAGDMYSVWKAPATLSGMTRALAGGASARAASCSIVPAATTWPAPLMLAGVRPCCSRTARTSSGSPPRTALIPVGVACAAAAMPRPRSRTRTMACSAEMTPAAEAAVISPTL